MVEYGRPRSGGVQVTDNWRSMILATTTNAKYGKNVSE